MYSPNVIFSLKGLTSAYTIHVMTLVFTISLRQTLLNTSLILKLGEWSHEQMFTLNNLIEQIIRMILSLLNSRCLLL